MAPECHYRRMQAPTPGFVPDTGAVLNHMVQTAPFCFQRSSMKKLLSLLVVIGVSLLVLTACASAQGFVELPGDVANGIVAIVLVAVSWFIAKAVALVPFLKFLEE